MEFSLEPALSNTQACWALVVEALQPDKDTVDSVLGNPALLAGFDDPEVMRAVTDIAADPRRLDKYRGQPKVRGCSFKGRKRSAGGVRALQGGETEAQGLRDGCVRVPVCVFVFAFIGWH